MSFRTVVIKNRVKMEYSLNNLICRGENEIQINLNEVSCIIVENMASVITTSLLVELVKRKIQVIFCDEKHQPQFELVPYISSVNPYVKIKTQMQWTKEIKDKLWQLITKEKITNQARVLKKNEYDTYLMLEEYAENVKENDETNREGHAAKVYFNSLFGMDFSRRDLSIETNQFLNYGYSLIMSAINREIVSFGYLMPIGIHHIGETNPYNLSCDFMEPLRPIVDNYVIVKQLTKENYKSELVKILSEKCIIDEKENYLDNAIHLYVQSLLTALNEGDISKVKFIYYEY